MRRLVPVAVLLGAAAALAVCWAIRAASPRPAEIAPGAPPGAVAESGPSDPAPAPEHYNISDLRVSDVTTAECAEGGPRPFAEFRLRRPARLDVVLCDDGARRIPLAHGQDFQAGLHALPVSLLGAVPPTPGVWYLEFRDRGPDGAVRDFDARALSRWAAAEGSPIQPSDGWSRVQYTLAAPALVRLRACLPNGLVLDTIVNGAYREAGSHVERWRRRDPTGSVRFAPDLPYAPTLEIAALPANLLRIRAPQEARATRPTDLRAGRRLPESAFQRVEAADGAAEFTPARGDYAVALTFKPRAAGPWAEGVADLTIAAPRRGPSGEAERVRIRVFVDLQPIFEGDATLPFAHGQRIDRAGVGSHVVSVMVVDDRGDVGSGSLPFEVAR